MSTNSLFFPLVFSWTMAYNQQQNNMAGGSGSQQNMGGYGTYNIDQPSSRVLAPPGGGSSNIFNQPPAAVPGFANTEAGRRAAAAAQSNIVGAAPPQQQQQQRAGTAPQQGQPQQGQQGYGGSGSQANMGGYGSYNIDQPSSRVLAPPGGGSSISFG